MKRSLINKIILILVIIISICAIICLFTFVEDEDDLSDSFAIVFWIIIGLIIFVKTKKNQGKFNHYKLNFGIDGKTLPDINNINYFREVPCNNDIFKGFWIIYQYELTSAVDCYKGLLGAILLEWLQMGYISIEKVSNGNYIIILSNIIETNLNSVEIELLEILKKASKDDLLEYNEFRIWSKEHPYLFSDWLKHVIEFETEKLEQEELIITSTEKKNIFLLGNMNLTVKNVQTPIRDEAIKLLGLKKFLLDYSLIDKRETKEIILWENYLTFAQLLGIADKVNKQLNNIYPDFSQLFTLNTIAINSLNYFLEELEYK